MNDLAVRNNQDIIGVNISLCEAHMFMPLFITCDVKTIDFHPVTVRPANSFTL